MDAMRLKYDSSFVLLSLSENTSWEEGTLWYWVHLRAALAGFMAEVILGWLLIRPNIYWMTYSKSLF
jgi:hypothetical protein